MYHSLEMICYNVWLCYLKMFFIQENESSLFIVLDQIIGQNLYGTLEALVVKSFVEMSVTKVCIGYQIWF